MPVTVFSFGRMNPPTLGHLGLARELRRVAREEGGEAVMYVSWSHDSERNPLAPDIKRSFLARAFDGIRVEFARTAFEAMADLVARGVEHAVFVVGEDRAPLAASLGSYAPVYGLRTFAVRLVERGAHSISATQVREAARRGDVAMFRSLVPSPDPSFADELYEAVGAAMDV